MPDGEDIYGIEKIIEMENQYCNAFPDMKFETKSEIAEGDEACVRGVFSGTHKGEFNGMAPTNKKVKLNVMWMCKFTPEGKIKECWDEFDNASMMKQITVH
jgi:predicted ester cyclase